MLKSIQKELGGKLKVEDKTVDGGEYCSLFYYIEGIQFKGYTYSIWFILKRRRVIATSELYIELELMILDDELDEEDGTIKYSVRKLPLPLFTKNNMATIEKAVVNLLKGHREKVENFYKNY